MIEQYLEYVPTDVITFFRQGDGLQKGSGRCYAEHCPVKVVDGRAVMLTGKPLALDTLKGFVSDLAEGNVLSSSPGILPRRILSLKPNGNVLWYAPAGVHPLNVSDSIGIQSGSASFPALLFALVDGKLYGLALKTGKARPKESSKVYRLPLWNMINPNGAMCMGTANYRVEGSVRERMDKAELGFFGSQFSHGNAKGCASGDIAALWKRLLKTGDPFPHKELLDDKLGTVADVAARYKF
ncbi:MAG: hypothetical protein KKB70_00400 [Proteobacteria bacterium]|nr:hypothetical protein [Pseudomonadota bacterium]